MRRVSPERLLCIPAVAALCVGGAWLPGLLVVAAVAVVLFVGQAFTMRRFRGGIHGALIHSPQ